MPVHLSGGHCLGDKTLEGEFLFLQLFGRTVSDLESSHSLGDGLFNLLLLTTLELERQGRVGDNLLNATNVRLELLLRFKSLAESLVVALESLGIGDHLLDLSGGQFADRVGNGDVGAAARGFLGGSDLQDTIDIDLKDTLEDGLTGTHGGNGCKGELSQRGIVLTVDTLTLVDGELNSLLVVGNGGECSIEESLAAVYDVIETPPTKCRGEVVWCGVVASVDGS